MSIPDPGSRIDIDAQAIGDNLANLRRELDGTPMVMVVKADAYGHGVDPVVPVAMEHGQGEFAVFSIHEGWHVRQAAPDAEVQIMGHVGRRWDYAAQEQMQPWLADIAEWPIALAAARDAHAHSDQPMRIHVEVETGMHRTGLIPDNAMQVMEEASQEDAVEVVGLCTHLAGAESERNLERIAGQVERFEEVEQRIEDLGLPVPRRHIASSSAALMYPEWRKDTVRVGVASYGLWPTPEVRHRYQARREDPITLRRVMTWRSSIMAVQDVPAGDCVGYGLSACMTHDTRIAVVPVGYGDGLSRGLSNAGHLLIHGQRCPIVGAVNMNMVQVDVSHLESAEPGDDVVLIGAQGEEVIGVHSFAEAQEVVDYEFMARLSQDIPRRAIRPPLGPAH